MLKIKKDVYHEMIEHCINCLPFEACGILAGQKDIASKIYKIKNTEYSSFSYFMEPVEQLKAMKDIRQRSLEMIAIFHSHPFGSPYPSQKDLELAFYDVYYLIVSVEPRDEDFFQGNMNEQTKIDVKCFKIKEGKFKEENIVID